jgi:hypothetical protein
MLKIFRGIKNNTTTAIIEDTQCDAVRAIIKRLGLKGSVADPDSINWCCEECRYNWDTLRLDKAIMNKKYTATVTKDDRDNYDEKVGEDEAVKKAMSNHNRAFKKALLRWQVVVLRDIKNVSPETFDEAVEKVKKRG